MADRLFQIDSTWLHGPSNYQEENVPVVGFDLAGRPIRQGFPTITFVWDILDQAKMTALMDAWDPESPKTNIRYVDKSTGSLVQKSCYLIEPVVGQRGTLYFFNVALRAVHLDDPI
ncbi:MAG TPA: hypothetical protein VH482_13365 [Thermomicrobiales bacterium]|jgi:hypothetical protein